jgi:tetratricopeptide (TPR) repeat protein
MIPRIISRLLLMVIVILFIACAPLKEKTWTGKEVEVSQEQLDRDFRECGYVIQDTSTHSHKGIPALTAKNTVANNTQNVSHDIFVKCMYRKGYDLEDQEVMVKQNQTSAELVNKGNELQTKGQFDDAIKYYIKSLYVKPYNSVAYNHLGETYLAKKKYAMAVMNYTQAIKNDPDNVDFYLARAAAYNKTRQYSLAIKDINKYLSSKKSTDSQAIPYFCRGYAYGQLGNYERSIEDFTQAITFIESRKLHNAKLEGYYFQRGKVYLKSGKKNNAKDDFKKACEMGDKDSCKNLDKLKSTARGSAGSKHETKPEKLFGF